MTYEEAIKLLHPNTTAEAFAEIDFDSIFAEADATEQACLVACEAMEKQVAKKPKRREFYFEGIRIDDEFACTVCGGSICYVTEWNVKENYKYCPKCGKKVDWSEI